MLVDIKVEYFLPYTKIILKIANRYHNQVQLIEMILFDRVLEFTFHISRILKIRSLFIEH